MLNNPPEYRRMAQAEMRLWWYRALHDQVLRAISCHPAGKEARIVDAACGTGGLMLFLRSHGFRNLSGFDVSPHALGICAERGLAVECGDMRHWDQLPIGKPVDVIVSNDSLYFFSSEEQLQIVRQCAKTLHSSRGLLILNVPAMAQFRGIHDRSVGITRRFSKSQMKTLLSAAGLDPVRLMFWPFILSPLIYSARLLQRRRMAATPDVQIKSDVSVPPAPVNRILEIIACAENRVLPWKPFGSSLFVVARPSASMALPRQAAG